MKTNRTTVYMALVCAAIVAAGVPSARANGKVYTWIGADGGSWQVVSNWDDGSHAVTGAPDSTDFAQFVSFSGKVTGALSATGLYVGPGSSLTLDGSGFFDQITVGQDMDGNAGDARLTIASGDVVSATMLDLGSALGGSGTLIAQGPGAIFSTTGGIVMDQTGVACSLIATGGGEIDDGTNLTMAAGGLIQVDVSSQVVVGGAGGGGTPGTLTIADGHFFYGEGTIAGNVRVDGTLETFNAGWPASKLTVKGNVTGNGAVSVVQELDIDGAIGSNVTLALFGNGGSNKGLLRLAQPTLDLGALDTMSTGSIIALSALSFDSVSWSDAVGLTLTGASATLDLATTGDHSMQSFSVEPDSLSGTDIIVGSSSGGGGGDSFDVSTGELTIPTLDIGTATYSNVLVTVASIVTPPSGTSPNGSQDKYDPATGYLTVQAVKVGSGSYYNVVVALSALDSIGNVSGADSYDSASNQLTIPSVQVVGGSAYRNVIVTVDSVKGVRGGMPEYVNDQYTPGNRQLLIPAVQAYGKIYTNVLITVLAVVSVGP